MKNLLSSQFRALVAIIVGLLLITFHEETVRWITILIGVMFFLSGVFSVTTYYAYRNPEKGMIMYDTDGNRLNLYRPVFPVVGLGSMALGVILALMPTTFITGITYIFALILIMAAANQFIGLAHIRQIVRIGLVYWVVPSVVMLIGLTALIRPEWIASAPLIIIGWAMVVYGVSESVNTLKAHAARRAYKQMMDRRNSDSADAPADNAE